MLKICTSLTNINSIILHVYLQISLVFYSYILNLHPTSFLTVLSMVKVIIIPVLSNPLVKILIFLSKWMNFACFFLVFVLIYYFIVIMYIWIRNLYLMFIITCHNFYPIHFFQSFIVCNASSLCSI